MNSRELRLPYLEVSELSESAIQITFIMNGMVAPRRGLLGLFKPGLSGSFRTCAENENMATTRENVGNGVLNLSLSSTSITLKCDLKNPKIVYSSLIDSLPGEIDPSKSTFRILKNKLILRLAKVRGSTSWAGHLAVEGLKQTCDYQES